MLTHEDDPSHRHNPYLNMHIPVLSKVLYHRNTFILMVNIAWTARLMIRTWKLATLLIDFQTREEHNAATKYLLGFQRCNSPSSCIQEIFLWGGLHFGIGVHLESWIENIPTSNEKGFKDFERVLRASKANEGGWRTLMVERCSR